MGICSKEEPRGLAGGIPVYCAFDEILPLKNITAHPKVNNQHPDRQIELLAKIIVTTGWRAVITISTRSGFITKGHGRMLAAEFACLGTAPVEYQHYADEASELADLSADNKIAALSYEDGEKTRQLLMDIQAFAADFEIAGFELAEIDKIIAPGTKGKKDPDEIPSIDQETQTITKPGTMWMLGTHRLLCADSTSESSAGELMQDDLAAMVFTDPPYNVDYTGGTGKKLKIMNDKMKSIQFYTFIRDALYNVRRHAADGASIYVCHADKEWRAFRSGMEAAGWSIKQCLVWEKNQFVMGRQDYHWRHEPILYGWNPSVNHNWYGGRKQDTVVSLPDGVLIQEKEDDTAMIVIDIGLQRVVIKVSDYQIVFSGDDSLQSIWKIAKPLKSIDHPTMKPVALIKRAIRNSSLPGDIVSDWFGGSGSTLIACEMTDRKARLMELDPYYCDVIVRRWEEFTGNKAEKRHNG